MKHIQIIIPIIIALLAFAVGYGMMKARVDETEKKTNKAAEDIVDIKMIDMRQTVLLEKLEAKF